MRGRGPPFPVQENEVTKELEQRARGADRALRGLGDEERRRATTGYFPTAMEILGVSAPKMRTVLGTIVRDLRGEDPARVLEMARLLRSSGTHEGRQMAFELLDRRRDARDLLGPREIQEFGQGNDNWASVDAFSVYVAGPVWREGLLSDLEVRAWARSPDLWWRRTALVSTVALNMKSRGGTGDSGRTLMVCQLLAHDDEPMVAKGLSWALRALVPVDREGVVAFLENHGEGLPALVRREVNNKLRTGKKNPGR
jgi:3-methyladenine DNA glycosylase AlkD